MPLGHITSASLQSDRMIAPRRRQERAFKENPWNFAKNACAGSNVNIEPNSGVSEAYNYFATIANGNSSRYNTSENQCLAKWIDEVMPSPDLDEITPFDLSAITPGSIKRVLAKRSSNSSPGEDRITYHHLKKMPSTNHFLATLFSKVLLEKHTAPESWCEAIIKLVYKGGDNHPSANFRPIALTSIFGKLFHKIVALRLERFVMDNGIIDTSLQKRFFNMHQWHNGAYLFNISYRAKLSPT